MFTDLPTAPRQPAPDRGAARQLCKSVVLADDHDLVRAGIQGLIELLPDVEVIAQAGSGEELLAVLGSVKADLVITDIDMPGMDGVETVTRIRSRIPSIP